MRRRDKVLTYIPYLTGGLYFALITKIISEYNINFEYYREVWALVWAVLTAYSTVKLSEMIELWDTNNNEEEEE